MTSLKVILFPQIPKWQAKKAARFFSISIAVFAILKAGSLYPIFEANYYSDAKKLVT